MKITECFNRVDSFKYLGRVLNIEDNNYPEGESSVGEVREVSEAGGGGSDCIVKVLQGSGTGGADL